MKTLFTSLLFNVFLITNANAQKTYVWEYYKVQITVPDDFRVKTNDDHNFDMKGDGMDLSMHIFEENVAIDDLDDATIEGAKVFEMTEIDEATKVTVNELAGYYVEGFKSGFRVIFAGLGDPNTHTNFFLVITFDDDDKEAEKTALEIIESLDIL
ncbi:MAG: hypothetical protein IPO86_04530 [Saprospiraceae bacterium]|nr:hypothetical protein [Saprospiraceae bacterium]